MVDPLENLIGFYSVVGRRKQASATGPIVAERSPSVISQGAAGSANARASGVTSALCVRTSELSKNAIIGGGTATTTTSKKNSGNVNKKVSNAHQMTSAGSGSESATMIKAFAQKLGPASSLIATSDASASTRQHQGQGQHNTGPDEISQ